MMLNAFPLFVSYGQIVVFRPSERQFNDWTKDHTRQNFAWRDGSVSFGVPDHDDLCRIEVHGVDSMPEVEPAALYSILVPFESDAPTVMIGSITEEKPQALPPARYALRFSLLPPQTIDGEAYGFVIAFTFAKAEAPGFAILRADDQMSSTVLTTTAAPPHP